ncbi:MAG: alpha-hydroxy-acid oxidizing protein [Saprospiraceae bacterium]|nr:alpha-hydroxy-acid oxidizing protein [Saprospiraceae bacterium]
MSPSRLPAALDRQRAIYTNGAAGIRPLIPTTPGALPEKARRSMSLFAWSYIHGGAGQGLTMRANESDFDRWRIAPRMMRDVETRTLATSLLDRPWPAPLFLAPIGALEMAHPAADLAVARAAAALGIPYIFSNQASVNMETCAAAMGDSPRWFQLYWSKSDELVVSFLQRAEACGCSALVLTLDTTMLGWRTSDLDLGFLPFLQGMGLAQYTSDPVFQRLAQSFSPPPGPRARITWSALATLYQANRRHPGNTWRNLRTGAGLRAVRLFTSIYSRPNITWGELAFLRQNTRLPIIVKGILHPDDARKAIDYGVAGIYVSNHGGRQVDGSVSAISALPAIAEIVRGRIPVLFDSGVRSGADIYKALALGADAVGIGRPYCYALSIDGQRGVEVLLENLLAELELTMALSGCRNLLEIRETGVRSA